MNRQQIMTPAMQELRAAINEADSISARADFSKRDEARINVLLAKISALRQNAVAPNDFAKRWFNALLRNQELPVESRSNDMLAGTQSIVYADGPQGGYLVPAETHDEIILGLANVDPLLDETVVTLIKSTGYALRPYEVPGWDLSTIAATKRTEGAQRSAGTVPTAAQAQLNGYIYTLALDASLEFEEDSLKPTMDLMTAAYALGFARGIGTDLVTGNGTSAPQGLLAGAHDSGITTTAAGSLSGADFKSIYFSVDKAYRNLPKCGWVMDDTLYAQARDAHDTAGRPLINVVGDKELIYGKPVYVSPSMPSTAGTKGIVFGDLSHLVVRVSRMAITRNVQAPGYIEYGKALYTANMRADAKVLDPTGGNKPPIVYVTLHA